MPKDIKYPEEIKRDEIIRKLNRLERKAKKKREPKA